MEFLHQNVNIQVSTFLNEQTLHTVDKVNYTQLCVWTSQLLNELCGKHSGSTRIPLGIHGTFMEESLEKVLDKFIYEFLNDFYRRNAWRNFQRNSRKVLLRNQRE